MRGLLTASISAETNQFTGEEKILDINNPWKAMDVHPTKSEEDESKCKYRIVCSTQPFRKRPDRYIKEAILEFE